MLALAFCRISGTAVGSFSEKLDLCGPGLVLWDWPPGAGGGPGTESKLDVESFQEGPAVMSSPGQKPGPDTGPRGAVKASQTRGGSRAPIAGQPRAGSTGASEKR